MPTRVFCGENCVREEGASLASLGRHALVVTGQSAKRNGALDDLCSALTANGQGYTLFDRVVPNPTIACVREGVALLRACGADFVVGVGGGSHMDAAKAIALLAEEDRPDGEIFSGNWQGKALPSAQIPTTAGTGSEVTQYAILTNDREETKTSLSSPALFARFAFLDARYTATLPEALAAATALDAFSHAAESLLSRRATPLSRALAREALSVQFPLLPAVLEDPDVRTREGLLYASALAGMAIAQSGTTAVHGMGYYLTYFYGIEHGRANGLLLGETLRLAEEKGVPAVGEIRAACGAAVEKICATVDRLLGEREKIPSARLSEFADRAVFNKNIKQSAYEPTREEIERIYLASFR